MLMSSIYFVGCSDSPGPVGSALLSPGDVLSLDVLSSDSLSQSSSSVLVTVAKGSSTQILLGKYNDAEASFLVQFDFSSLPDTIKNLVNNDSIQIKQAVVKMYAVYFLGDKTLPFDYSVHKINNSWSSSGFTIDSLSALNYDAEDVSSNKNVKNDTTYYFNLDINILSEWLKHQADTTNAQFTDHGLYIEPSSGSARVVGFQALSATPAEPYINVSMIYEKLGQGIDDTLAFIASSDIHVVKGSLTAANSENFFIQGGIAVNAKLKFALPLLSSYSIVNSADLTLTYDSTKSDLGTPAPVYLTARFLTDSTLIQYDSSNVALLTKNNNTYTGSISGFVQRWINGEKNNGMLISFYNEDEIMDLLAVYAGTAAEISKRPLLKVKYSTKK
jgi:hypothetical protein